MIVGSSLVAVTQTSDMTPGLSKDFHFVVIIKITIIFIKITFGDLKKSKELKIMCLNINLYFVI